MKGNPAIRLPVNTVEGVCHHQGKARYRSRKAALTALGAARRSPFWNGQNGNVYRCPHCRSWHLTHYAADPMERLANRENA